MRRLILLCLLATAPAASFAVPVTYDLSYTSSFGPSGAGSAIWDGDTHLLSQFTWDLGPGRVGGFVDSFLSGEVFGGTYGAFLWEVVSGDVTAHPEAAGGISTGSTNTFGYGALGVSFSATGLYTFNDTQYERVTGLVRATLRDTGGGISVPEPASLALFGLGLFGLALSRRKI